MVDVDHKDTPKDTTVYGPGPMSASDEGAGPLSVDNQIRLLRAKAGQLEAYVPDLRELEWLIADIALLFRMLGDHIASCAQEPSG